MSTSTTSTSETSLFPASKEELAAHAQGVREKAEKAAQALSSAATDDVSRITDWAKEWWHRYASSAVNAATAVKEETDIVRDQTRDFVRHRPMQSLLIAAAVGAVVGGVAVLASRRDR